MKHKLFYPLALTAFGIFSAAAQADVQTRYQVTITNLTANQPLSPPALVLHDTDYHPFMIGHAASNGLEHLAEGGETMPWLMEARAHHAVYRTQAGDTPIGPGMHMRFMLHLPAAAHNPHLSAATMLVNTNDGFAALMGKSLADLPVGGSMQAMLPVYDAGTEENSEAAGTIPGPADGGAGFNPARESRNMVTAHPGVVTMDDGLAGSVLNESHRFQNPAAMLTVTRLPDAVGETHLGFLPMQAQYHSGERVHIAVNEAFSIRGNGTDLWFAVQIPDGTVWYLNEQGAIVPEPQPFERHVMPTDTLHTLLDFMLPPGLSGYFSFFAAYGTDLGGMLQLDSTIAYQTVWLNP
jgi:hypothetical protein